MLIRQEDVDAVLKKYNITVRGALHIGAHECEEIDFYKYIGLTLNDVVWIDAIHSNVFKAKKRGIPNVYNAIITDKDDMEVEFNVSNNVASSSILELNTPHNISHPEVVYVNKFSEQSITVDSFFKRNELDPTKYNLWNIDIQGAELLALKGGVESLKHVDIIYVEVNEKEMYKGCPLVGDIDTFLLSVGFTRVFTDISSFGWGDAMYVNTSE
jgi:FkbM family methyltransferase